MQRLLLAAICALMLAAAYASAQQLVSVFPGDTWADARDGFSASVSWRIASRGGAVSPRGVFINLDNNRELGAVDRILEVRADQGVVSEEIEVSARQLREWHKQGVRRLGYRRTFAGAAGALANHMVIDLTASGRLADVDAAPAQQTLSGESRQMMLRWDLQAADIGDVNAYSPAGQFLLDGRVIYEVPEPLRGSGGSISESVQLPPGLVEDLLARGVRQLRYSRTFVDDRNTRRSASIAINLAE